MKLPEKIQRERKKMGLSQEKLAEKIGVSRQAITKWENGLASPELEKIVSYYRADPTTRICIERKQANVMENVAWRKFVWNIGADYICIMATFCSFSYFGNDRKRCPFNRI